MYLLKTNLKKILVLEFLCLERCLLYGRKKGGRNGWSLSETSKKPTNMLCMCLFFSGVEAGIIATETPVLKRGMRADISNLHELILLAMK